MLCLVVLTCMFVVWLCFLTLVTAPLLQEQSSTFHHEEALTKAAKQTEELKSLRHARYTLDTMLESNSSAQIVSAHPLNSEAENLNTRQVR